MNTVFRQCVESPAFPLRTYAYAHPAQRPPAWSDYKRIFFRFVIILTENTKKQPPGLALRNI